MKKMIWLVCAGFIVGGVAAYSTKVLAEPKSEVSEAQVNARVDARLRQLLAGLILERAQRSAPDPR